MGAREVLPDSRTLRSKREEYYDALLGLWMVKVYCASCSKFYGHVNRDMIFAFVTCNDCDIKYGVFAGHACDPDFIVRERVAQAIEDNQALKTPEGFMASLSDPNSELSKIAKAWHDAPHVRLRR